MGGMREKQRCDWAKAEPNITYHDTEWGVPLHDDRALFELLILEGAQAGLSWTTILNKRAGYRHAFDDFDARRVARYDVRKLQQLLANPEIVRNRLKVSAAVQNAKAFLEVQKEFGSFDAFIWRFVGGKPIQNAWRSLREASTRTDESDAMSKDLAKRGFKFVGSTICYAFMQATGMVNDHLVTCFRYREVTATRLRPAPGRSPKVRPSGGAAKPGRPPYRDKSPA
jgi:DNA-3-methyladenine glycosylase I